MMPVMIWGIIIAGKAYSGRDWLATRPLFWGGAPGYSVGASRTGNSLSPNIYIYIYKCIQIIAAMSETQTYLKIILVVVQAYLLP